MPRNGVLQDQIESGNIQKHSTRPIGRAGESVDLNMRSCVSKSRIENKMLSTIYEVADAQKAEFTESE
ncbi:hypothetical protein scyTo_0000870 [Scyliorhinus torazame]|uniref:Uncharacterized protein n=1 Tax=Scyliorhinus torazame TaxID=75743 RepID=A0A401P5G6_SCYTO|nr:hypothetical protein [Scyliorhinus torazame]